MYQVAQEAQTTQSGRLVQDSSKIPGALDLLSNNLGNLHETIEQLTAKLYPLMSPKPSPDMKAEEGIKSTEDPTTYTVTHINALANAVFQMNIKVRGIYENLDL